jgi:hypothetical protein
MIVNMACPKCGGQATEYEEKKWSCSFCGNRFVLAADPSHTFVQSNIHIQGQATFELDVPNAKAPVPKMVKMNEHNPDFFGKRIAENRLKITAHERQVGRKKIMKNVALSICGVMWFIGCLALLGALLPPHDSDQGAVIVGLVLWAMLSLFPFAIFLKFANEMRQYGLMILKFQQANLSFEQQNLMDTKIGDFMVCPHCDSVADYFPLKSPPPKEGLKHCLKCGRQYFTNGLTAYRILINK